MSYTNQSLAGPWEDFARVAAPYVSSAQKVGGQLAEDALRSSEFGVLIEVIEKKAREAVVAETQKNALLLIAIAVAGGAVGGALFKGTTGVIAASGITALAALPLLNQPKKP